MKKFSFIVFLKEHPGHDKADQAHDNGLTDCSWTTWGGTMYLQFEREGNTFEEVALETFKEVAGHEGLNPEYLRRLNDGTDVDTQSGFYPGSEAIYPDKS